MAQDISPVPPRGTLLPLPFSGDWLFSFSDHRYGLCSVSGTLQAISCFSVAVHAISSVCALSQLQPHSLSLTFSHALALA